MSDDPASGDGMRWTIRQSLVERLRIPWDGMGEMANQQRAEAAVQIDTMMDEIEAWRQAMQKAERDIAELRDAVDRLHTDRNNLRLEIDRMVDKLTAQRDEARRRLCAELLEVEGHPVGWKGARGAEGIAERLGWDCFKEKP